MTALDSSSTLELHPPPDPLALVDRRTREILERRRNRTPRLVRRGWALRRSLLAADLAGVTTAFVAAALLTGATMSTSELALLVVALAVWVVAAKLHGLYDADAERADHSTVDDLVGVFHLATLGAWLAAVGAYAAGSGAALLPQSAAFWGLVLLAVAAGRAVARGASRRSVAYLQNTIIVGAGDVGQLIARKLLQHPEYGLNLVGFVDVNPRERRSELGHLAHLGGPERLPELIRLLDVERVVVAFSNEPDREMLDLIRAARELDVQIDLVPRLFELVGPRATVHSVEGLALLGLPPVRLSRLSRLLKRALDVAVATLLLAVSSPLVAYAAWRIKRDSRGPVFFRQTRLGEGMREFTVLKFRTMHVGTSDAEHRRYIANTMSADASVGDNGLYKLERTSAVTRAGRWLRKTSLDELPQLVNVIRGDMSLVGPRPCLAYETENFRAHHFERFLVPPGITGLWQVTARASSTFGEALDMDVRYVRSRSLWLDLRLLLQTPFAVLRQRRATA